MGQVRVQTQSYLKIFLVLVLSTFFIQSVSLAGNYVYEHFFEEFQFDSGASIGPIPVGGLSRSDALEKVEGAVHTWQSQPILNFKWNGKNEPVYSSVFTFEIKESVERASVAGTSPLHVNVNEEAFEKNLSQLLDEETLEGLDRAALQQKMLGLASALPTDVVELALNEYLKKQPVQKDVIHVSVVQTEGEQRVEPKLFSTVNGYEVKAGETVSLLNFMDKKTYSDAELYSMNLVATGIYQVLLHTNFEIVERHNGREKPTYANPGYEASIIPNHWDLIFKNPNPTSYILKVDFKEKQVLVSLEGAKLTSDYVPFLLGEKELPPKTIVHYNANLLPNEKVTKVQGKPGSAVEVWRQEWKAGKLVGKERISEDFYPPVHRVEEWGPVVQKTENSDTTSSVEKNGNATDTDTSTEEDDSSNDGGWFIIK